MPIFRIHKTSANPLSPRARRERGQSLIEFSLMVVALTVVLAGVVDLGRAYFTYLALKDAASEGAYFGSVYPQCASDVDDDCAAPNNIDYRIRNTAPRGMVNWSTVAIDVEAPDPTPGQTLTVTVTYDYDLITPFVGAIAGGQSIELDARSAAVIMADATP